MSPRSIGAPRSSPVGGPISSVRCGLVTTDPSGSSLTSSRPTTLGLLAECFEELGGVPNLVVPAANYVRFASHYGFRPDFCHAADPQYQGVVENLVGHAKDDLLVPLELDDDPSAGGYAGLNQRAGAWGVEVGSRRHSETPRGPDRAAGLGSGLLGEVRSLRTEAGPPPIAKEVDKLSCIQFGSVRYSVPNRLIGTVVMVLVEEPDRVLRVIEPVTGEVHAEHARGTDALTTRWNGAVSFRCWRADDIRPIWPPTVTRPGPPRPGRHW